MLEFITVMIVFVGDVPTYEIKFESQSLCGAAVTVLDGYEIAGKCEVTTDISSSPRPQARLNQG